MVGMRVQSVNMHNRGAVNHNGETKGNKKFISGKNSKSSVTKAS